GYQFANPKRFSRVDLRQPPILLYDEKEGRWDLTGVMFVAPFDQNPTKILSFEGAEYLKHPRMCHYQDGTNLNIEKEESCPAEHPITKEPLIFWHPDLWIMSAWVWYPNPNGLFALDNPLLRLNQQR
ncbi:MAG: hypothetical protein WAO55_06000, partial [Candidatus Manganitrophaceae bacterium]